MILFQIKNILCLFILAGYVDHVLSCTGNSSCNSTTSKEKTNLNVKEKEMQKQSNDTKVGAESSESHRVVEGLSAFSKFNSASEGGFQPSPFLGLVPPEPGKHRDVVGYGEAIPVPLHDTQSSSYSRHRIFPPRGFSAKTNLPLLQGNHLPDDFSTSLHSTSNTHISTSEHHHEIPGHAASHPLQAELSVQPEPTNLPDLTVRPTVNSHPSEVFGRHPAVPEHPWKVLGYPSTDQYSHHLTDSGAKPEFGTPLHYLHPPVRENRLN